MKHHNFILINNLTLDYIMEFLYKYKVEIIIICCALIIIIVGSILTIHFKSKDNKNGTVTKETTDETTNGVPIPNVNPNVVNLVNQLSIQPCTRNSTYGTNGNSSMYTSDGCSGIFTYQGQIGYCGGYVDGQTGTQIHCPIGNLIDDKNGNVKGLIKPEIVLVKDISGGKCTQNNYGINNYNSMYVDNGCNGLFRIGSLIGYCGSEQIKGKYFCPIGQTQTGPDGMPLGLRYQYYRFIPSSNKTSCQYINTDSGNNTYGLVDANHFYTSNNCSGTFNWSNNMSATCTSQMQKDICPLVIN